MTAIGIEELLSAAPCMHEPRRSFDVAGGLRRLAEGAGYVTPTPVMPRMSRARQQLAVVARWELSQPGAATHLKHLAAALAELGESEPPSAGLDIDVEGGQVFACALYLAGHPESAQFWWQLAAGAEHGAAAYCLYLRHAGLGETTEATHWMKQLQQQLEGPSDDFIDGLERVAGYVGRHGSAATVSTDGLEVEVERLVTSTNGGLVYRPDRQLADRLDDLAGHS